MNILLSLLYSGYCAIIRSRTSSIAIFALLLAAFAVTSAWAAERGRVSVRNGTVLSDRNTLLRGATTMLVYGYVSPDSYWKYLHDLGLNAVRYNVKTGQFGRTVEQQLPGLDVAVERAANNNLYLMILNSIHPGGYNLDELKAFWAVVAPRYKDRTHVFYEMTNEPVGGRGHASQYTDKVIADLGSVYQIMRRGAPNTHIVLFSTANLNPDCPTYAATIAKMRGVDWSKASVGFHHYNGTQMFGSAGLKCLRKKYPLLMTETNYWRIPERAPLRNVLSSYESLAISWFSLDGNGSAHYLEDEIIPALHLAGYHWQPEN